MVRKEPFWQFLVSEVWWQLVIWLSGTVEMSHSLSHTSFDINLVIIYLCVYVPADCICVCLSLNCCPVVVITTGNDLSLSLFLQCCSKQTKQRKCPHEQTTCLFVHGHVFVWAWAHVVTPSLSLSVCECVSTHVFSMCVMWRDSPICSL